MRTELGRSQVEVQQCALSSEVGEELGQVEAEVVEEEEDAGGGRRRRRRRRTRRRRRMRRTALIKSNNPHLAGGEKTIITIIAINKNKQR